MVAERTCEGHNRSETDLQFVDFWQWTHLHTNPHSIGVDHRQILIVLVWVVSHHWCLKCEHQLSCTKSESKLKQCTTTYQMTTLWLACCFLLIHVTTLWTLTVTLVVSLPNITQTSSTTTSKTWCTLPTPTLIASRSFYSLTYTTNFY